MPDRTPAELPNEHQLYLPIDYVAYKPITDHTFNCHPPSADFPGKTFVEVEEFDTNLD
jgi:hypothetical protein